MINDYDILYFYNKNRAYEWKLNLYVVWYTTHSLNSIYNFFLKTMLCCIKEGSRLLWMFTERNIVKYMYQGRWIDKNSTLILLDLKFAWIWNLWGTKCCTATQEYWLLDCTPLPCRSNSRNVALIMSVLSKGARADLPPRWSRNFSTNSLSDKLFSFLSLFSKNCLIRR